MKSTIKGLYLSVPTPCEENWSQMTRTAAGRHCSSCNKTVVDFSILSDAAIFAVINNSKGAVCGRFSDDQLQRQITGATPVRNQFVPATVITAGLAMGIATASHAESRGLEQIEMSIVPNPVADTSVVAKSRDLPEVVVVGYEMKKSTYSTGMICVRNMEIKPVDKPLLVKSILYKNEPLSETKKKKKRFLFF